eukprot:4082380-Amphidinium_carterae.2
MKQYIDVVASPLQGALRLLSNSLKPWLFLAFPFFLGAFWDVSKLVTQASGVAAHNRFWTV